MVERNHSLEIEDFCARMNNLRVTVPIALAPINIIGSGLILRAIYLASELNKISTFQLIANLCASDMMLSVIGLPLLLILKFHQSLTVSHAYHISTAYKTILDTKQMASALTLISMSVDKVLACIFHLKYNNYLTKYRSFLLIFTVWVLSLSWGATNWLDSKRILPGYTCTPVRGVIDVAEAAIQFVCFIVIISCNVYLMLLSKQHQKQDREQRREANSTARKIYEHYKSIKSLILIVCMFGVGLFPLILYFLIQQFVGCTTFTCTAVWEYLNIIHYFDLNTRFVIYCLRFQSLCRCIVKMVGCDRLRKVRVSPNAALKDKQENGAVTMIDKKVADGVSKRPCK